jgi:hypothetical protein
LAQRAVMLQGRCFPNDGRAPAAAGGLGAGNGRGVACTHLHQPAPARSTQHAARSSITEHAPACSIQHMQAALPYSCDIILTATLRLEGNALISTTRPNFGHHMQNSASGCVPCHGIPNEVLHEVKLSSARENQNLGICTICCQISLPISVLNITPSCHMCLQEPSTAPERCVPSPRPSPPSCSSVILCWRLIGHWQSSSRLLACTCYRPH